MNQTSNASRELVATSGTLDPSIEIVVCIPSFRRPQHLQLTLESLAGQRTDRRFAVVVSQAAGLSGMPALTQVFMAEA